MMTRERLFAAITILLSTILAVVLSEGAYRAFTFYKQAIEAGYPVTTIDEPMRAAVRRGILDGEYLPSRTYAIRQYNGESKLTQSQHVHMNNHGWVSSFDYQEEKEPGEFRIAVVGDSLTACINSELPWVDVLWRELNKDTELLAKLGAKKISVLNLGVAGGSFQLFASPLSLAARQYNSDLLIANVVIEDLARRHGDIPKSVPPRGPTQPLGVTEKAADITVDSVGLYLTCSTGRVSIDNPACKVGSLWQVPKGLELSEEGVRKLKRRAGASVLTKRILFARRLLIWDFAKETFGRSFAFAQDAKAAEPLLVTREDEDIRIGLDALRFMREVNPNFITTLNPLYWYMHRETRPPLIERFLPLAMADGNNVIDMGDWVPQNATDKERYAWYNLPDDGHWNNTGAEVYGKAMAKMLRAQLLSSPEHLTEERQGRERCAKVRPLVDKIATELKGGNAAAVVAEGTAALAEVESVGLSCRNRNEIEALMSIAYESTGRIDEATKSWNAAISNVTDPASYYELRADGRLARGDFDGALSDDSKIIELNPDSAASFLRRARLLGKRGDQKGAAVDFAEASRRDPQSASILFELTTAHILSQNHAAAVESATRGLQIMPDNAGLFKLRATSLAALSRTQEAIADLDRVVEIEPSAKEYKALRTALAAQLTNEKKK